MQLINNYSGCPIFRSNSDEHGQWKSNRSYIVKAFDMVNHSILLEKLSCYGIHDDDLAWFQSCLSNRNQVVCNDDVYSDKQPVQIGVAQGSILGPLLFTIFLNDLPNILNNSKITYADDAAM